MSTIAPGTSTRGPAARRRAFRSADLGVGLLVVVATAGASWWLLGLPATHVAVSIALYLPLAAVVLAKLPADDPGPGIGPANRVTLGRCALAIPVAAMLFGTETGDTVRWWIVGVSTVALLLDGVDGAVARHTDAQTRFGARFDMEVDAALILVLSVLVWRLDRAASNLDSSVWERVES
jgi:phosphatidylserine synthase